MLARPAPVTSTCLLVYLYILYLPLSHFGWITCQTVRGAGIVLSPTVSAALELAIALLMANATASLGRRPPLEPDSMTALVCPPPQQTLLAVAATSLGARLVTKDI